MRKGLFILSLASALAFAASTAVPAEAQSDGVTLVAAKKHKTRKPAPRAAGPIACTFLGCTRIPAGCRPVTDYDWDGMPTGFDAVVCPNGKFYSRS